MGLMLNQPDAAGEYPLWDNSQLSLKVLGQAWLVNDIGLGGIATLYTWLFTPFATKAWLSCAQQWRTRWRQSSSWGSSCCASSSSPRSFRGPTIEAIASELSAVRLARRNESRQRKRGKFRFIPKSDAGLRSVPIDDRTADAVRAWIELKSEAARTQGLRPYALRHPGLGERREHKKNNEVSGRGGV